MSAALFRRALRTCRSRQLTLTLSWPPTNQRASGEFHSRTFVQGLLHSSSRANDSQKASGSAAARSYTPGSFAIARVRQSADGAKTRPSFRRLSISGFDIPSDLGLRRRLLPEERQAEERPQHGENRVCRHAEQHHHQDQRDARSAEQVLEKGHDFRWNLRGLVAYLLECNRPTSAHEQA